MKIGIDLDCTLNDMMKKWLSLYNKEWGDSLKDKDITEWEVDNFIKKEARKTFFSYLQQDGFFFYDVRPQKYAKRAIDFLLKQKHEIYIVTAYVPEGCLDKVRWIKKHFPKINENNIIFCNNKSLLKLDMLIDDGIHNFDNFYGVKVVYTQPWNISKNKIKLRLNTWKDIKKIELLKNKVGCHDS